MLRPVVGYDLQALTDRLARTIGPDHHGGVRAWRFLSGAHETRLHLPGLSNQPPEVRPGSIGHGLGVHIVNVAEHLKGLPSSGECLYALDGRLVPEEEVAPDLFRPPLVDLCLRGGARSLEVSQGLLHRRVRRGDQRPQVRVGSHRTPV